MPLSGDDSTRSSLRTLEGAVVQSADLPLLRAWRRQAPQEASFLFSGSDGLPSQLLWSAAPLADAAGVSGILSSLIVVPLEPDWQQLAGLAHDLRTPLQALRLLLPLLEGTAPPAGGAHFFSAHPRLRGSDLGDRSGSVGMGASHKGSGRRVESVWFALGPFLQALADEQAVQAQSKAIAWRTDFAAAADWKSRPTACAWAGSSPI